MGDTAGSVVKKLSLYQLMLIRCLKKTRVIGICLLYDVYSGVERIGIKF